MERSNAGVEQRKRIHQEEGLIVRAVLCVCVCVQICFFCQCQQGFLCPPRSKSSWVP